MLPQVCATGCDQAETSGTGPVGLVPLVVRLKDLKPMHRQSTLRSATCTPAARVSPRAYLLTMAHLLTSKTMAIVAVVVLMLICPAVHAWPKLGMPHLARRNLAATITCSAYCKSCTTAR
jgi:hypothetical protein